MVSSRLNQNRSRNWAAWSPCPPRPPPWAPCPSWPPASPPWVSRSACWRCSFGDSWPVPGRWSLPWAPWPAWSSWSISPLLMAGRIPRRSGAHQQGDGHALERLVHGADLGQYIDAVGVLVDQPLQAPYLALDPAQSGQDLVLIVGVPGHLAPLPARSSPIYTPLGYDQHSRGRPGQGRPDRPEKRGLLAPATYPCGASTVGCRRRPGPIEQEVVPMMNGYAMSSWGWLLMTLGLLGSWALVAVLTLA